jgi:hypothetical protein
VHAPPLVASARLPAVLGVSPGDTAGSAVSNSAQTPLSEDPTLSSSGYVIAPGGVPPVTRMLRFSRGGRTRKTSNAIAERQCRPGQPVGKCG